MAAIQVGDLAPEITFATHAGDEISLAEYRGRQAIVLFFYPRDGTPVCAKEACSFRDA